MKFVVFILYIAAAINLTAIIVLVGLIWFGFGYDLLANQVGELLLTLLASSILMVICLEIIRINFKKESKKSKTTPKTIQNNLLARAFLKEQLNRELSQLNREQMKNFTIEYICMMQDLLYKLDLLEKIED